MLIFNSTIDVSVIDDDLSLINYFCEKLKGADNFNLRWAGDNITHFLENAVHKTDIVLLDILMGEQTGKDLISSIKEINPNIQVIMHTIVEDTDMLIDCLKRGADGYLLKDSSFEQVLSFIEVTYNGGASISPLMVRKLSSYFSEQNSEVSKWNVLNDAERQVLKLLSDGYSYKIIADKLDISLDSVRYYIKSLYKKLQVNSKGEAIRKFLMT